MVSKGLWTTGLLLCNHEWLDYYCYFSTGYSPFTSSSQFALVESISAVGGNAANDAACSSGCTNSCDFTDAARNSVGFPLAICWHEVGLAATRCSCIPAGSNSNVPAGQPS